MSISVRCVCVCVCVHVMYLCLYIYSCVHTCHNMYDAQCAPGCNSIYMKLNPNSAPESVICDITLHSW